MLLLVCVAMGAQAAVPRAFLQPDRVAMGESTTLNIEVDELFADVPDFSVLERDFEIGGTSSSKSTTIINGRAATRTLYAVELLPRREGLIGIPPLQVGKLSTEPLVLNVTAAPMAAAARGANLFLEAELGTTTPYVQEVVPYTLRLYYAINLLNGDIQAPTPDGVSLERQGEDRTYQQTIGNQRYNVFERRYLLVPERSGAIDLPAAVFRGRALRNGMDGFFDRGGVVSVASKPVTVQVRPQPANAPQPWLPVRALGLFRSEKPAEARVGEPLVLELSLTADGANPAQMPELNLPPIAGAQVFPEPPQTSESVVDGRPQAIVKRRFAIVPGREGQLRVPELRVGFWNTANDQADAAVLPPLELTVAAGAPTAAPDVTGAVADVASSVSRAAPGVGDAAGSTVVGTIRNWQVLTALLALGLVIALAWGWRRGRAAVPVDARKAGASGPSIPSAAPAALRRALAHGDLSEIGAALRAFVPGATSLAALQSRLEHPAQREAIAALERSLWAPTADAQERSATLANLRAAFKNGPALAATASPRDASPLPPLYPQR